MTRLFPQDRPSEEVPQTLEGVVERIVYSHPDSGWTVLRLSRRGGGKLTVVGRLPGLQPGEAARFTGRWKLDRKYGRQFEAASYLALRPETRDGMRRYLGSGLIEGIGKVMARRLVDQFGLETLQVIEQQPERLTEVEGVGPLLVHHPDGVADAVVGVERDVGLALGGDAADDFFQPAG